MRADSRRGALAAALASAGLLALVARMDPRTTPLLFVALVPWLAALDAARSLWRALACAATLTLAFVAGVFWWFGIAAATYAGVPVPVGVAVLLLLTPVLAPQFVVAAAVRWRVRAGPRPALAPLAGGAAWLGAEWLLPKLFGDTLGHGLYPARPLRQAADLVGVPGLTALVLFVNESVLAAVRAGRARRLAGVGPSLLAALAAVIVAHGYGRARLATLADARTATPPLTVAIVQANIGQYARLAARAGTHDAVRDILDTHFALARRALAAGPPDLMVWPETVYPTTFGTPKSPDGAAFDREIAGFVATEGVPLVFGSYDAAEGREYNAAVLLERAPAGDVTWDAYRKAALFPLIEYVPAWLDRPALRRALPWLGSWTPGPGAAVLAVRLADRRALRIAPLVCYDATRPAIAWAAVRDGAEVLVTLSNDSWFDDGAGPWLHLVVSAFRSVETHRPQVRATNTGISAIINAAGDLVARADVDTRAVLLAQIAPARSAPGLAVRAGGLLGPLALAVAIGLVLWSRRGTGGR